MKCVVATTKQTSWNGVHFMVSAGTALEAVGQRVIDLLTGSLDETDAKNDTALRITTLNAEIGVRGTQFEVLVEKGVTTLYVFSGSVEVTSRAHPRQHALVHADQMAVVTNSHVAGPRHFSPASVKKWWVAAST